MNIPTRHNHSAISRYRPFIESVSRNWPTPILVDPDPLTGETFACRFRDAVVGVMVYGQAPDLMEKISIWSQSYSVGQVKGTKNLCIGRRDLVRQIGKKENQVGLVIDARVGITQETINTPSQTVLNAIVVLLDHGILDHATLTNVTEETCIQAVKFSNRPIEVLNHNNTITLLP